MIWFLKVLRISPLLVQQKNHHIKGDTVLFSVKSIVLTFFRSDLNGYQRLNQSCSNVISSLTRRGIKVKCRVSRFTLRDVSWQDEELRCHCPRLRRSRRPGRPRIQGLRRIRRQQLRGPMETDHQPRPHCGQGGGLRLSPLRRHGPQDPASRNQPWHQAQEERNPPPMPPSKHLITFVTQCDWALIELSFPPN